MSTDPSEERIAAYEADTDFLEISGMEYIEMLYNRSEIAEIEDELSDAQRGQLIHTIDLAPIGPPIPIAHGREAVPLSP